MSARQVFVPYEPREAFMPFHQRGERWAILVCHRRAGKTTALLADMLKRALEGPPDGRYAYIAPLYSQAKSIAWDILLGLTQDVATKRYESELRVDLLNGARIRLFGSDNPDSLRGLRFDGAALDEYADIKPNVFAEIIRPALADRGGWCIWAGTPKGHGHFRDLFERARQSEDYFVAYLPVSATGLLGKTELDDARAQMSEELYRQEFECSWEAPRSGSYYGALLEEAERDGRIGEFPPDPDMPVSAAFDLGWRDSTAIWYWQPRPGGYQVVDHDEAAGRTVDDWVDLLRAKGYDYDTLWLPHDARAKSMQTGRSTVEQLLAYKLPCRIAPQLRIQQGIDAVRMCLPRCVFHEPTTTVGLRRLRAYGRTWNDRTQSYADNPRHDENSHSADAFRMAALVMREHQGKPRALDVSPVRSADRAFSLEVLWQDRATARAGGIHAME